jgi:hypothetical protein
VAGGPRLACPWCQAPVAANPNGHWFQKFQCPHCRKPLQFDARTNNLGIAGWAFFAMMVLSAVMLRTSWVLTFAGACGALWIACSWLSYQTRRIAKA